MAVLFNRQYKLNINGLLVTGSTANANGSFSPGLRIRFLAVKTIKPDPNSIAIDVWNLSAAHRKDLQTQYVSVELQAGYGTNLARMFLGDLRKADSVRQGTDWISRLRAGDGLKDIRQGRVSAGKNKGTGLVDAIQQLVNATGIDVGNAIQKAQKGDVVGALQVFGKSFVAQGRAYDQLSAMFSSVGYDLSVQNGQLQALGKNEVLPLPAVLVSSQTGMVGSPEAGEKGVVKVKSLLNTELTPGRQVVLKSSEFNNENFRVEKAAFQGDSHQGEWTVEAELTKLQV